MSCLRVPPFDVLQGQSTAYAGFGDVLDPSLDRVQRFDAAVQGARQRLEEGFAQELNDPIEMAVLLDKIIDGMWREGWDPDASDINLFVRDFGLVLASSVLSLLGGDLVFRSEEDLSHLSIWWPVFQVEAFPFHKVYKRLYVSQGESIVSFVRGVSTLLNPQDGAGR